MLGGGLFKSRYRLRKFEGELARRSILSTFVPDYKNMITRLLHGEPEECKGLGGASLTATSAILRV